MEDFLTAISSHVIVADGGMGTLLRKRGAVKQAVAGAALNMYASDAIRDIQREYVAAGARVLETNTFCATPVHLEEHGLKEKSG